MPLALEVNFDGLIGPTHNYGVQSWGNRASMTNYCATANPKAAALQGLEKMKRLHDLGVTQGVLPPLVRPYFEPLRQVGFTGTDADLVRRAATEAPALLAACYSASAMWAANSATVSPAADTPDGKVHFSAANLISKFHRAIEADQTAALLRTIFRDTNHFRHHEPLPRADLFADEGAANHTRLCVDYGDPGLHLFVYGRDAMESGPLPQKFPARQTRQASEAICRRHGLRAEQVVFAQQNPAAIDAGVFHNDVIATGNRDVFFFHELAYVDTPGVIDRLGKAFAALTGRPLRLVEVTAREIPLDLAVSSYLFNSQIVNTPDDRTILLAPRECASTPCVRGYLDDLLARPQCPFDAVDFTDVNQSMRGGGGPACLRLRVVLTDDQLRGLGGEVILSDALYDKLKATIRRVYPEAVSFAELADPGFAEQCWVAMTAIYDVLCLASVGKPLV